MIAKPLPAVIEDLSVRDLLCLVEEVCRRRGVPRDQVCGRTRTQSVSRARQEVWWLLRHHPERHYSLLEIARLFGRDHATVVAGLAAHHRRCVAALG
jgi:chromosomal replication initiation ATPase DnaA